MFDRMLSTMNINHIAALAAFIAVPAIVTSCGPKYSTPGELAVGVNNIVDNLIKATLECTPDDVSPFVDEISNSLNEYKKMQAVYEGMTRDEKKSLHSLLSDGRYDFDEASKKLQEAIRTMEKSIDKSKITKEAIKQSRDEFRELSKGLETLSSYPDLD